MPTATLFHALQTDAPEDIETWCRESIFDDAATLRAHLEQAITGNSAAAYDYVRAWRSLSQSLLVAINAERPDLVVESEGHLRIVDVEKSAAPMSALVLDIEALSAPFSSWVARTDDVGVGSCAALIQKLRSALVGYHPVVVDAPALPHLQVSQRQLEAFMRNVTNALGRGDDDLGRIQRLFDLNTTETSRLFSVSRQAIQQWQATGVPARRYEKLSTVGAIADLLESRLKTRRLPGIVRRSARIYDDHTILEMIERDQQDLVLRQVRSSFDWSIPA